MKQADYKRVLILGFGRMGVSHALQIAGILRSRSLGCELFVLDPSFFSRMAARFLVRKLKISFIDFSDLARFPDAFFDVAVDASPPFDRSRNIAILANKSKYYLIEKPVLSLLSNAGMSGYVLQHAPLVAQLREELTEPLARVSCHLDTNLRFSGVKSWRSSSQVGGVCREFLGHVLSVPLSCLPHLQNFDDLLVAVEGDRIIIKVDISSVRFEISLAEGQKVRKTAYSWQFEWPDNCVIYDGYQIKRVKEAESLVLGDMPSSGSNCDYYLRGFDFCRQAAALLDGHGEFISPQQHALIDELTMRVVGKVQS